MEGMEFVFFFRYGDELWSIVLLVKMINDKSSRPTQKLCACVWEGQRNQRRDNRKIQAMRMQILRYNTAIAYKHTCDECFEKNGTYSKSILKVNFWFTSLRKQKYCL